MKVASWYNASAYEVWLFSLQNGGQRFFDFLNLPVEKSGKNLFLPLFQGGSFGESFIPKALTV